MRQRYLITAICFLASGCSLLLGDGYSAPAIVDGADAAEDRDVAANDAGEPSHAEEAGSHASAPSLLAGGDFEEPRTDCGLAWYAHQGISERISEGHESGSACRACRDGSDPWFGLEHPFGSPPGPGRYQLDGWLRFSGTRPKRCRLGLQLVSDGGSRTVTITMCNPGADGWQLVSGVAEVLEGEEVEAFFASADGDDGVCFDMDDLSMTRLD